MPRRINATADALNQHLLLEARRATQRQLEQDFWVYPDGPNDYHTRYAQMKPTMSIDEIPSELGPWLPYSCCCPQCSLTQEPLVTFKYLKNWSQWTEDDSTCLHTWMTSNLPTYNTRPAVEHFVSPFYGDCTLLWIHDQAVRPRVPDSVPLTRRSV